MKRNNEAAAMLEKIVARFSERVEDIRGQSSLVVAAFVEAQPEGAVVPPVPAQPTSAGKPVLRIRIPEGARKRLSTTANRDAAMPADSADPVVQGLLSGLNRYHLWLMADAVGAVSAYYRSLIATMGYLDPETLPCSSYGDLRMAEVGAKPPAWFEEKAAAFVESHGMVAAVDNLSGAVPTLKRRADVKTPPGVWFRGSDLFLKLILECNGSLTEARMDGILAGAGVEANEALRVLGVMSCVRVQAGEASLWMLDTMQGSTQAVTKRFESLLGRAQDCVEAGHAAAMEHFGLAAAALQTVPAPQPPSGPNAPRKIHVPAAQKPAAPPPAEVPKGKDPTFVPIKLQEPAGRYRPVKGGTS